MKNNKIFEKAYANGPTGAMALFVATGGDAWMKRKTYNKREAEAFAEFLAAVEEMKEHFNEMRETA